MASSFNVDIQFNEDIKGTYYGQKRLANVGIKRSSPIYAIRIYQIQRNFYNLL